MEFESSPGGWDDISSSDFEEGYTVAAAAPVIPYSESESESDVQPTLKAGPAQQQRNARAPQHPAQPRKVNPMAGTSFVDNQPSRGPIDMRIGHWLDEEFQGMVTVPFKKIGRVDGSWLFGLRRIKIKIGQKTGQLYVDLGANSMTLVDFWGRFEYTEQRKIDGAAAGTQALLSLLQAPQPTQVPVEATQ